MSKADFSTPKNLLDPPLKRSFMFVRDLPKFFDDVNSRYKLYNRWYQIIDSLGKPKACKMISIFEFSDAYDIPLDVIRATLKI